MAGRLIFLLGLAGCLIAWAGWPLQTVASENNGTSQMEQVDTAWQEALGLLGKQGQSRDISALKQAIDLLSQSRDPRAKPLLEALYRGDVWADGAGLVLIGHMSDLTDARTGARRLGAPGLVVLRLTNTIRRAVTLALARLGLHDPDPKRRLVAVATLSQSLQTSTVAVLEAAFDAEQDPAVRKEIATALALFHLRDAAPQRRLDALDVIAKHLKLAQRPFIESLAGHAETNAAVRGKAKALLERLDRKAFLMAQANNLLQGLSLGSILLLAALGLAITFGLLGIINMAHGEMLMVGAYVCHVCVELVSRVAPHWLDWAILLAIPAAFVVTAVLGMAIELLVIARLYGRPLESLLATWGISLALIQASRLVFGAQNVAVPTPSWLSGDVQITDGLSFATGRLAMMIFALVVAALVHVLVRYTTMGLALRAVTQDRAMAAALGLKSAQVDRWTFALGAGVAGMAGVAIAQLDNVGPNMGQGYIVDAFMVVVLGGVGQLGGTMIAAFGLGILQKFTEPAVGAVLAKVAMLLLVIFVIQRRPQGLFALRTRSG